MFVIAWLFDEILFSSFFLFPTTTVPLFSPVVWQKICPGGRIRALVRNEEHFFHFFWKFSFNYRGVVCLAICLHFLFLFSPPPSSSSWIKVDLSSISSFSDIELFEWINLLPLMKLAREPPAYTCAKLRSANRFRANVNIHDAAKEFQLEVESVNFNHNYSRPLFIGCSV